MDLKIYRLLPNIYHSVNNKNKLKHFYQLNFQENSIITKYKNRRKKISKKKINVKKLNKFKLKII